MGRAPCCDKANVKKGPWSPEEDAKLKEYIEKYGTGGNWIALPQKAGLKRCGKSCRLRWLNYLRPNLKHGDFTDDEDRIICTLFSSIGSRWSIIAAQLPGRTDNDIKNYWNTKLKKKLIMGIIQIPQIKPNPAAAAINPSSSPSSSSSPLPYQQRVAGGGWSFVSPPAVLHAPSQDGFVGLNVQPVQENVFSYGGDQASCSSSDGSYSNQLGYGGEMEYDYGGGGSMNGNYFYSGVEDQKPIISESGMIGTYDGWIEKENSMMEETQTPLEYSLEEIKRLISCNNSLSFDEYKTEERVIYF